MARLKNSEEACGPAKDLFKAPTRWGRQLQLLLDADDEIHAFFSEVVEGFVVVAEVPVADLDAQVAPVLRRGFVGTDIHNVWDFV